MKCRRCSNECIKKGFQVNRYVKKQRYRCISCNCYQLEDYHKKPYCESIDNTIIQLNAEGNSISGIARIIKYSKQTVIRRMLLLASRVKQPIVSEVNQTYEVDEMWTFVGDKKNGETWLTYALNNRTNRVMFFHIGNKTSLDINRVVAPLKMLNPKKIVTDKLNLYPKLVRPHKHDTQKHRNNHIERANLTLRQHLKRLSRKTLCYSKSIEMLKASFILYLYWNNWILKDFK
jgi:insertion element IS1 protein InsB